MLLSLPGTPFLYYGDEIGMGDNHHLNDRDGVRTPMQWHAGPTAGFSQADPAAFSLPLITDPEYAPARVNVADQMADPSSLLNWVRDLLALRKRHRVFGTGSFELVDSGDPAVLAFRRWDDSATVVVLANFGTSDVRVAISGSFRDLRTGETVPASPRVGARSFRWLAAD